MTNTTASAWDELERQLDDLEKPVRTLKLCKDINVRDRFLEAQQAFQKQDAYLNQLKARADGQAADADALALVEKQHKTAKTELAAAQKAYDAKTVTLRFTALERKELERLQKANPPTEEDEANGEQFAMAGFAPALISAASLDGMPIEAARKYLDTWSTADATDLWRAAWSIQHQQRTDLGKG